MKFLIALSVLASTSVFANDIGNRNWIKCYEPAEQGERGDLVYKIKAHGQSPVLHVVYPFHQPLRLNEQSNCLEHPGNGPVETLEQPSFLRLCPTQGQSIDGLVPVEAIMGEEDDTVYCEREILPYFEEYEL